MAWGEGGDGAARAADLFARKVDLALPPELRPVLARRLRRRRRANLVAAWVMIVAGLALALAAVRWGSGAGSGVWLGRGGVVAAVLATAAVGQLAQAGAALAAQAGDVAARGRQVPRASHLPRPRLADYLAPAERWLARDYLAPAEPGWPADWPRWPCWRPWGWPPPAPATGGRCWPRPPPAWGPGG